MFPDVLLCFLDLGTFPASFCFYFFVALAGFHGRSPPSCDGRSTGGPMWGCQVAQPCLVSLLVPPSTHQFMLLYSWGKDSSFPLDQNRFSKPPFSSSRSMFVFDAKGHDPGSLQTLCQNLSSFWLQWSVCKSRCWLESILALPPDWNLRDLEGIKASTKWLHHSPAFKRCAWKHA